MSTRTVERTALAGLLFAAVLFWLLVPTYPNYDAYYHLVWGREILGGALPSFDAYAAPTPHPLYLLITTVAALFGEHGDRLLVLFTLLSHVGFTWAVYRLGSAVWDRRAGALAAFLAGSSFALVLYAVRAYVDVPYLALVFWAAALEAEKPLRGRRVLAILALAGLLRPEGWLLSGLYLLFLWLKRRSSGERVVDPIELLLVVAAPIVWMACDWIVTGDPLWSLNATSKLAEELGRDTGLASALREGVKFVAGTAREPVAAAAVAGLVVAWRKRDWNSPHILAGLAIAGTFAFLTTSALGLSVLPRYLTVPAVVLCLLAGYLFSRTRVLFGVAVVGGFLFIAVRSDVIDRLTTELRFIHHTRDDLRTLVLKPQVQTARKCGSVSLPNYRLVPDTRWYLDASEGEVIARSDITPVSGAAIVYTSNKLIDRYGKAAGASIKNNRPPDGFHLAARTPGFAAYVSCSNRPQSP